MSVDKSTHEDAASQTCTQMITEASYRDALGRFATGVAIVTTTNRHGAPVGATINTITSVSIRPPLILWCLATSAPSFPAFRDARYFAVNILPVTLAKLCKTFSHSDGDKFSGVDYRCDETGLPLIGGALAHIVCSKWRRYPGGDHEIFVGQVRHLTVADDDPLVVYRGQLQSLARRNDG